MLKSLWRRWTATTLRKSQATILRLELLEGRALPSVTVAEFPVLTAGSSPYGITAGADGNVWFTENLAGMIGSINPTTHAISEYTIPTASSGPSGIAAGPDGNLWFTELSANKIGEINSTTHTFTEFPLAIAGSQPTGITAGPDGNLWFTELGSNKIGQINPTTHAISEFALPTSGSAPAGIAAGPDGNLWFTENSNNKIGSINPTTHTIAEYPIPTASSQPTGITAGPDGNLWFTENNVNKLASINPSTHAFAQFAIPTAGSQPIALTAGPDGNLWFLENNTNKISSFNPTTHAFTETALPTSSSSPAGITAGPKGTLWFTESAGNQIGEVVQSPTITTPVVSQTVTEGQTATFTTSATGFPTPTVQWQVSTNGGVSYTPLSNNSTYSGVTTTTLTITAATAALNGSLYKAVFSNGISPTPTVATVPATLTVTSLLSLLPALPQGVLGTLYNQTISVVGSTTPFNLFAVNNFNAGGTGLTLANITTNPVNGTIAINGTPTAAGSATFTVAISNTAGNSLTQTLTIVINPPLSIATLSLPQATAGMNYSQSISVIGGAMPYTTFTISNFSAGTTGLAASALSTIPAAGAVLINGIPTAGGTATFTLTVTDSAGTTATANYTITVNPPLVITPTLPAGTAGTSYSQVLTVTGGGVPYATFNVLGFSAGTTGLTAAAITTNAVLGTFTLSGTPIAAGTLTFTANVIDALGAPLKKTYTITINPALAITASIPQGTAGTSYHPSIDVAGGTKPYATFTVTGFSAGTTGVTTAALTTNSATGIIALNGTPTASGTATFTVNVTDAAGASLTKTYTITINPAPTIGSLTTTQWTAGVAGFTGTLPLSGGSAPLTIASSSGLPTGLTAVITGSNLAFTGSPTTAGSFAGSITLHDAAGAAVTKTFSITINSAPSIGSLSAIEWTVGRSGFNGIMTTAGGTGGLTLAGSSGLPTGLSLVLTGNTLSFTGTPTAAVSSLGSVTLRDAVGATVTRSFHIIINAVPTLGSLTTTQWTVGKSGFTGTLAISAGTAPFTISSFSGLPAGLTASVQGNSVVFLGTPSTTGTFASGSITVHDAAGATLSQSFSITINPPVQITTTSLPPSRMASLYSATVQATGGTGITTFTLSAGSLPPGMKLSANGVLSGATRGFGAFTFTILATDAVGATFSKTYTLSITRFS